MAASDDPGRLDAAEADSAGMLGRFALRREGHGDQDALAYGLLLESAEGVRLASELIADQQTRESLSRHADELMALLEAWSPLPLRRERATDAI